MSVVEHRPVLRRIEIGSRIDVDKRRDVTEAMSGVGPAERDRIWRLVEQAARGVSAPAPDAEANVVTVDQPAGEMVVVELVIEPDTSCSDACARLMDLYNTAEAALVRHSKVEQGI